MEVLLVHTPKFLIAPKRRKSTMPKKVNDLLAKNMELLSVKNGDTASVNKDRTYHEKKLLIFSNLLRTKNLSKLFSQDYTSAHERLSKLISESATQLYIQLESNELEKLTNDIGETLSLEHKVEDVEKPKTNPQQMAGNGETGTSVDEGLAKAEAGLKGLVKADGDRLSALYALAEKVFDEIGIVISPDIDGKEKFSDRTNKNEDFSTFMKRVYQSELSGFGVDLSKLRKHDPNLCRRFDDAKSYYGSSPFPNIRTMSERDNFLKINYAKKLFENPVFTMHWQIVRKSKIPRRK